MTVSGTFTLDGTGTGGATIYVIDTAADPSTVVGTSTTASDGTWSVNVDSSTTLHVLCEYEDPDTGEQYTTHSKPYVSHDTSEYLPASAIHQWKFDEGSGTTAADSIGGADGTINNATWTQLSTDKWVLDFNGTDAFVDTPVVPSDTEFGSGGAMELWINWRTSSGRNGTGSWGDPRLYIDNYGGSAYSGYGDNWTNEGSMPATGEWHQYILTHDGTTAELYIDNSLQHSYTSSYSGSHSGFEIGDVEGDSNHVDGLIGTCILYNDYLSDSERQSRYDDSAGAYP